MTLPDTPETTPSSSKGKKRKISEDDDEELVEAAPNKKGKRGRKTPFGVSRGQAANEQDNAEELPSGGSNGQSPVKGEDES